VTMLKVNEMSIEEVARATTSTIGAVKQVAHRAYGRLRRSFGCAPSAVDTQRVASCLCRTKAKDP
jgi:RNA polymerase sigma-70 factor (ECF subfamily)